MTAFCALIRSPLVCFACFALAELKPSEKPAESKTTRSRCRVRGSTRQWILPTLGVGAATLLALIVVERLKPHSPAPLLALAPPGCPAGTKSGGRVAS